MDFLNGSPRRQAVEPDLADYFVRLQSGRTSTEVERFDLLLQAIQSHQR